VELLSKLCPLFIAIFLFPLISSAATKEVNNEFFIRNLVGQVNGKSVVVWVRRSNELFNGYFGYPTDASTTYVPQKNWVQGKINRQNEVTLNSDGKPKVSMTGKLTSVNNHYQLTGNWKQNGKQFNLELNQFKLDLGNGLMLTSKDTYKENHVIPYTFYAVYPFLKGDKKARDFDAAITRFIKKERVNFVKFTSDAVKATRKLPKAVQHNTLTIDYVITQSQHGIISVRFMVGFYYAGAAHPNYYYTSFTYDINNEKLLKLSDLFKPNSAYLNQIANYTQQQLKKRILTGVPKSDQASLLEMINDGSAPKAENYQAWNLSSKGLLITFAPYQVAPYVYGHLDILVPYTELSKILQPKDEPSE